MLGRSVAGTVGVAGLASAITMLGAPAAEATTGTGITDWINITNSPYNADGSGKNDSTTGIQQAINDGAASGTTVYVPSGTFLVSKSLTLPGNTTIQGGGPGSQIMWNQTAVAGPLFMAPSTSMVQYISIRDLRLAQTNPTPGGTAIEASHFQFSHFERLIIQRASGGGHVNIGVSYNSSDTHYNVLSDSVIFVDGSNAKAVRYDNGANSNVLRNCRVLPSSSDASQIGVYVNAYAIELDRPDIENAAGKGISMGPMATSNRPTQIIAPYLEGNGMNFALNSASAPAAFAARWTVVKPSNTGRHSTTTAAQDPHLALTMIAGHSYMFEMMLVYDGPGSGSADLKVSLIAQGVATITWSIEGLDTTVGISATHGPAIMAAAQSAGTLRSVATAGVGKLAVAHIKGIAGHRRNIRPAVGAAGFQLDKRHFVRRINAHDGDRRLTARCHRSGPPR
jgi:hypothetical protein